MKTDRCRVIVFSKVFPGRDVDGLIAAAHECGFEGYDLCLRQGYAIHPGNVRQALPDAQRRLRAEGLAIPMISGEGNLVSPTDPSAEPILAAMDAADVRILKLGYVSFVPGKQDYWAEVDKLRAACEGWEALGRKYKVRICLHAHAGMILCNCAAVMHAIRGRDPAWIGAYIDPCHMMMEGEGFALGAAMLGAHVCMVGLKDVTVRRTPKSDHGSVTWDMGVSAGEGVVDWDEVFGVLGRMGFQGPLSAHCTVLNYGKIPVEKHVEYIRRECAFFRRKRDAFLA